MTPAIEAWIARDPAARRIEGPCVARFVVWQSPGPPPQVEACAWGTRLSECADADAVHAVMVAAAQRGHELERGEVERELRIAKAKLAALDQRAKWLAEQTR